MTQQLEAQESWDTLLEKTNSDLSKINPEDVKFNCDKILQNVPEPEDEENNTEKEKNKAIKDLQQTEMKTEDITTDQQHIVEAKKIIDEWWDTTKIKALNWELAEQLIANYQWEILDLSWLQSIDSETSSFISEFKWKSINLSWLTSLDNESAFRLWDFQGEELNLSWVTNLNERQARWLSNFQWQIIRLGELANLKKIVEERLSAFWWIIYSNWIELALASTKI